MTRNVSKKYYMLADGQSDNAVEVSVFYSLDTHNYFTSQASARGYYISASPVGLTNGDTYRSVRHTMFRGLKQLLSEASRFSQKVASKYSSTDALAVELFYKVCEKYDLQPLYDDKGNLVLID